MANKHVAEEKKEKTLSSVEEILLGGYVETHDVEVEVNGKKANVKIKNHIDLETRKAIVASTEAVYFADGTFNKAFGDALMEHLIFTVYTGLSFGDDLTHFDAFRSTAAYYEILNGMPDEANILLDEIHSQVEFIKPMYNAPVEQKNMNDAVAKIMFEGVKLLEHLENAMDSLSGMITDKDNFKMGDLLKAMSMMEAKDESKIAKAVLDFQEEKAKRVAASTKEPETK